VKWPCILAAGLLLVETAATTVPAPAAMSAGGYSTATTPLGTLIDDPKIRLLVEKALPGLLSQPQIEQARGITLRALRDYAPERISEAALDTLDKDLGALTPAAAASTPPPVLDPANPWITDPAAIAADGKRQPVSLQFRREIMLRTKPDHLRVAVSADNRFQLFVNGTLAAMGPARGDLAHWRTETVDLARWLKPGRNVIAAQVWNDGRLAPVAQISSGHTGFMLRALDRGRMSLDTGPDWRVRVDKARTVASGMAQLVRAAGGIYYAAGGPETIDAGMMAPDWKAPVSTASDWHAAVPAITTPDRTLVEDALPQMTMEPVPSGHVVRATGITASAFPSGPVSIAANSEATVLVDAGRVLSAYPALATSGGKGATVTVTYTEALYDPVGKAKPGSPKPRFADRATVDGGLAFGLTDTFRPDGAAARTFQPHWWRTWRFAEIKVKTADAPLTLDRFDTIETRYPFQERAWFHSSDPALDAIWRIGWRTTQLDAHETFMDTAYWEQLQYIGDTRLEALISYDVSGDPRLGVQAIEAFDGSRSVDGLPQAAWPASAPNSIPPFALIWIGMLHDYWMHQPDPALLKRSLPGMRAVIDRFAPYIQDHGLVGPMPGWGFVDWAPNLDFTKYRGTGKGPESCVISLLYVGALQQASDLERSVGEIARAGADRASADAMAKAVNARCWDEARGLYADTPDHASYSQHANALAVLYDVAPAGRQRAILERVTVPGHGIDAPAGITGTTYYFSYYLARAFDHAGLADRYPDLLGTWRGLLARHFTTWPENPDPSRSDSHAWSAHPTSGLLEYVAGIAPAAPGFARVQIAPHLGTLTRLDAALAAPAGLVRVRYAVDGDTLRATLTLPAGLSGDFLWKGGTIPINSGINRLTLPTPR
jgi:hypothetical protein